MPEKKKPSFLKSLRFRILIILVILGIVPSVIVAHVMVAAYENKAVAVRKQTVEKQCDILCNLLIKENYMNDSSSQNVNSKLELLSNVYDGRILLVDRDYRIIKDTYGCLLYTSTWMFLEIEAVSMSIWIIWALGANS